jgi:hypothetical protein
VVTHFDSGREVYRHGVPISYCRTLHPGQIHEFFELRVPRIPDIVESLDIIFTVYARDRAESLKKIIFRPKWLELASNEVEDNI